jgi:hypothetical protein
VTYPTALREWVVRGIEDPSAQWSMGTFGAIAEFSRDLTEPARVVHASDLTEVSTIRGGVRVELPDDLRAVAYETTSKDPNQWGHAIALCLPIGACAMNRRTVVHELGRDEGAIRSEDGESILFDLGLGTVQVDVCVRTSDPELLDALRAGEGQALFDPANPAMRAILAASPHRVFLTRVGRGEVYQAIPPAGGRSPDGPHTHLLPKLLRSGRTHAATTPIPQGWAPCASLYPAHPKKDGLGVMQPFDRTRHEWFQKALALFGDPELTDLKQRVAQALATELDPKELVVPPNRFSRNTIRVALRQAEALNGPSAALTAWRREYDNARIDLSTSAKEHDPRH